MNPLFTQHIQQQLSRHLQQTVHIQEWKQVFGGDINTTYIIQTNRNRFFVKLNNRALPDMYEKEFNGLTMLHNADALYVPLPLLYGVYADYSYLAMECIEKGTPSTNFWLFFA